MAELLDLPSWRLGTADLIQQLAVLVWLNKGEDAEKLYKLVTGARVGYELYSRMSSEESLDTYQAQCILGIVNYIKEHPRASQDELAKEVQKRVEEFKTQIENL